ncbi:MAG: HlyD family type I secretion periplasmic adaptor subunit [Candidatus Margulisiibacteriota bacterium]
MMPNPDLFESPNSTETMPIIRYGGIVIFVFFIIFVLWGSFAQLSSASMANGFITLPSKRQTVQHLEGGIIQEILIKDGDFVAKGQDLIILNNTLAKANFNIIMQQYLALLSRKCRLLSERDFLDTIEFQPLHEENIYHFNVQDMIELENRFFKTRKTMLHDQLDILSQQRHQIRKEIDGIQAQLNASIVQKRILSKQVKDQELLFNAGVISILDYNQIQQQFAEITGEVGALTSNIAKLEQSLIEISIQKNQLKSEHLAEIVAELSQTDQDILDIYQRHTTAKDTLDRVSIKAPVSGVIKGLNYTTEGGVIEPSSPIMDIVPQDEQFIIEAKANPIDIDNIKVGQYVKVQLTSFSSKELAPLDGELIYVSADQHVDEGTGMAYFNIHVSFKDFNDLNGIALHPGMPAMLQINTGSRTFFEYITAPIIKVVQSSFKES